MSSEIHTNRNFSKRSIEPPDNITFKDIVETVSDYTPWRRIYPDPFHPKYVGRLEDRWGWSFQADLSFEESDRQLLLQIMLADKVHRNAADVWELILIAESYCDQACNINYDEELGTLWIWAQIDCTRCNGHFKKTMYSFCSTFKMLLESEQLMKAIKIGGGQLRGVPIDLFSEKYNELISGDIIHPQLQGELQCR